MGCGKSTLFKLIMNIDSLDKGTIDVKKGTTIGYLEQKFLDTNNKVIDVLNRNLTLINKKMSDLKELEEELLTNNNKKLLNKYMRLLDEAISNDYYNISSKINEIRTKFNISDENA